MMTRAVAVGISIEDALAAFVMHGDLLTVQNNMWHGEVLSFQVYPAALGLRRAEFEMICAYDAAIGLPPIGVELEFDQLISDPVCKKRLRDTVLVTGDTIDAHANARRG